MEVRRTVPVKLTVSDSDAELLHETIDEFQWAANYVVNAAFDDGYAVTSKRELHDRTYEQVRDETQLHSNLVQAARSRAADSLKSVVTKWKRGKQASRPHFSSLFLEYDQRSATFNTDHATLSTVEGRITAEYVLPNERRDTPHSKYLLNDEYEMTGATLHYRPVEESFYLHVRTKAVVDDPEPSENGTVLGVDLGIENIAVTSTGEFWSGDELNHWRREYEKRRASMQQQGTRYAHEAMQRLSRKETGRFEQMLHRIANGIVSEARENGCSVIAFEDLTGIRDRMSGTKRLHVWAFRRLFDYVAYKAEPFGIDTKQVNPAYTSQRCSRIGCGFTADTNRPSQDTFECQSCGYETHADYNAAKNIGLKYLRRSHKSSDGGAPVGVRLNSRDAERERVYIRTVPFG